jgi:hypothetical protein
MRMYIERSSDYMAVCVCVYLDMVYVYGCT